VAEPTPEEILDACGDDPTWICERVLDWTGSVGWAEATDVVLGRPVRILFIVLIAYIANRLARRAIHRITVGVIDGSRRGVLGTVLRTTPTVLQLSEAEQLRLTARATTLGAVGRGVVSVFIWTIAFLMILGELDINLAPLLAGAGIAGAALGFGAQSIVKDFLAGFFMIVEDQFGVGDVIDVGEASGVVEEVSLRRTRLRGTDGTVWHVPNGEVQRVGNKSQQWSRALLDLPLAYETDLVRAKEIMSATSRRVCESEEWAAKVLEPPEVWGVERLGSTGIIIRIVVKTLPGEQWGLMRALREALNDDLAAEHIELYHGPVPPAAPGVPPSVPE
jgi:moderate conductance mechanosensitive channel